MASHIYFKTNQEQEDFLNVFVRITALRKAIWNYLRSITLKYRQCWPAQETIATALGCCRDAVNKAIKYFRSVGWLCDEQRAYQTNVYYISDNLLKLNTRDSRIYNRNIRIPLVETAQNTTVYNIHRTSTGTLSDMHTEHGKVFEKRERTYKWKSREIPYFLKHPCLSEVDQQMLANQFSDTELLHAIDDAKDYFDKHGRIYNLAAFMTKLCKNYREKLRCK